MARAEGRRWASPQGDPDPLCLCPVPPPPHPLPPSRPNLPEDWPHHPHCPAYSLMNSLQWDVHPTSYRHRSAKSPVASCLTDGHLHPPRTGHLPPSTWPFPRPPQPLWLLLFLSV